MPMTLVINVVRVKAKAEVYPVVISQIYPLLTLLSVLLRTIHFCRRSAFMTTISELSDMPIAAPQGGIHPAAANGTAIRL